MADVDIQRYLDDIESQHATKPKYMAHVTALLEKVDDVTRVVKDMPRAFYVREAVGAQLDVLGQLLNLDRRYDWDEDQMTDVVLDDEDFRRALQMRVVGSCWDGSMERYIQLWHSAVGYNLDIALKDNQDMTVEIDLTGEISYDLIRLIQRGYYIPKPMGVGVNINVIGRDYFGTAAVWPTAGPVSLYGELGATAINSAMEG